MLMYVLIGVFILAIIIVVVLSVLKIISSVVRTTMTILFIVIFATSFLIYYDSKNIQDKIQVEQKMMILDYGGVPVAGFTVGRGEPDILEDPETLDSAYARQDLDELKGENYMLFIIKKEALQDAGTVEISGYSFTISELNALFVSQDPKRYLEDKIMAEEGINESFRQDVSEQVTEALGSQNRFKGLVFAQTFSSFNGDQEFLVFNLKDENIILHPEPISFKLIRFMPRFVLNWIV